MAVASINLTSCALSYTEPKKKTREENLIIFCSFAQVFLSHRIKAYNLMEVGIIPYATYILYNFNLIKSRQA